MENASNVQQSRGQNPVKKANLKKKTRLGRQEDAYGENPGKAGGGAEWGQEEEAHPV